ncbi:MAG: hypothetical protein WCL27_08335 [Betaproteobacteria bacterium]
MFCRAITFLVFSIGVTFATLVLARTDTTSQSAVSQAESKDSVIPKEVARAIKRAEVCHYLAGELGGDNSNRDKEVNEALKRNRCSSANAELRRLKIKYKNQAQVLAPIEAAE